MEWTTKPPDVAGWYWILYPTGELQLTRVTKLDLPLPDPIPWWSGWANTRWSGPVTPPDLPQPANPPTSNTHTSAS